MKEKEIKEHVENGKLRISVMFEIVGKPKKHVEDTLKAYIARTKQNEEIIVLKEEYEEAEDAGDGLFSTIAEVEMLIEDIEKLTWLAVNFSPASIEILEPAEFRIEQKVLTHWMNDLLSRLHEIGMMQKSNSSQVESLIRNFNAMTRNAILLALREVSELKMIAHKIGMDEENTQKFLDALIKENKIKKEGSAYYLV